MNAESFDAVVGELDTIISLYGWPKEIRKFADRLQAAHDHRVEVLSDWVSELNSKVLRADRAVGLLRDVPSVIAYAMNLCNGLASEALQDEAAAQITSLNARVRAFLAHGGQEKGNG